MFNWQKLCGDHVGTIQSVAAIRGGLVNQVHRVVGDHGSLVAKFAPPFVASAPQIPLDPERLAVEAAALAIAGSCATFKVRAPKVLEYQSDHHVLLMEDLGPLQDLFSVENPEQTLEQVARFLNQIHSADPSSLPSFGVHESRAQNQYQPLSKLVPRVLSVELEWAASYFATLPQCFTMGDLWPASILVSDTQSFVIDWEFAASGHPEQDVAHLAAHVCMKWGVQAEENWLTSYDIGAWSNEQRRAFRAHRAAEILQRTIGAFPGTGGAQWLADSPKEFAEKLVMEFEKADAVI